MRRRWLSPGTVIGCIALFAALGGSAYALVITGKQIKNNSVTRADVRNGTLRSADIADGSLRAKDFAPGELPAGVKGDKGDPGETGERGEPGAAATPTPEPEPAFAAATLTVGAYALPVDPRVTIDSEVGDPPRVRLERPQDDDLTLSAWHDAARQGDLAAARKSATLTFYDAAGTAVQAHHLEAALPVAYELDTSGPVAKERATLEAEFIQRVAP